MPDPQPSHREIMARVDGLSALLAQHEIDSTAYRTEVRQALSNIANSVKVIGESVENMEDKVFAYDLLKARIAGMIAAGVLLISTMLAGFWWAFHSKIEAALGIK